MVKVRDILPLIQWNDAQIIKDQDEEICLLRNDFMVGSLSEEILNMTVTGIENDENIENTVVVYVTDEEDQIYAFYSYSDYYHVSYRLRMLVRIDRQGYEVYRTLCYSKSIRTVQRSRSHNENG